jgi:hypothetical protein
MQCCSEKMRVEGGGGGQVVTFSIQIGWMKERQTNVVKVNIPPPYCVQWSHPGSFADQSCSQQYRQKLPSSEGGGGLVCSCLGSPPGRFCRRPHWARPLWPRPGRTPGAGKAVNSWSRSRFRLTNRCRLFIAHQKKKILMMKLKKVLMTSCTSSITFELQIVTLYALSLKK